MNPSQDAWIERRLRDWLVEGGDDRLLLDPQAGLNRYGCGTSPDDTLLAFGSSTASTILRAGSAAAEHLLEVFRQGDSEAAAWNAGACDLKRRLAELCGLQDWTEDRLILGPSGTDVCGLAADLARAEPGGDTLAVILPEPAETGRGAPEALCPGGAPIAVAIRDAEGQPRPPEEVDAEVEQRCVEEIGRGRKVLLCLLDVSKTGFIAPSPEAARRLKAAYGEHLSVLVDACQFRLSVESLAAYLDAGFEVAITGSKFLAGPTFSGALLRPASRRPASRRAEPLSLGLLLRWEAALAEFAAFRRLPDEEIARVIDGFGAAVQATLDASSSFQQISAPDLRRFEPHAWDTRQTIYSFLPLRDGRPLDNNETAAAFARLRSVRLGQPVKVAQRSGESISALRMALSARQIVCAASRPDGVEVLTGNARDALASAAAQLG